jgi:hypothetical protein
VLEGQLLELAVQAVEAQPVGDGRVDLLGFAGDAAPLVGAHVVERPHVVQTVGQLDQDDPQVAGHGQQHLAEVFGLGFFVGLELDLVELGDAIDQLCRDAPEALGDLGLGDVGVLHHVMEEGGTQGLRIQVPAGENLGDGYRMGNVGLAALAHLPVMGIGGKVVGGLDAAYVFGTEIGRDLRPQPAEIEGHDTGGGRLENAAATDWDGAADSMTSALSATGAQA